jgi:hypothetical protein
MIIHEQTRPSITRLGFHGCLISRLGDKREILFPSAIMTMNSAHTTTDHHETLQQHSGEQNHENDAKTQRAVNDQPFWLNQQKSRQHCKAEWKCLPSQRFHQTTPAAKLRANISHQNQSSSALRALMRKIVWQQRVIHGSRIQMLDELTTTPAPSSACRCPWGRA